MTEKPPTTLIISTEGKVNLIPEHADAPEGQVQQVFITRRGYSEPIDLYKFKNLSNTEDIELQVYEKGRLQRLPVPEKVTQALREYIQRVAANEAGDIDCFALVCLVEGMSIPRREEEYRVEAVNERWKPATNQLTKSPGDVFFLFKENGAVFTHAAIYLGKNFYVSAYGLPPKDVQDMGLEFSTMKDMYRTFGATKHLKMVPRN